MLMFSFYLGGEVGLDFSIFVARLGWVENFVFKFSVHSLLFEVRLV